jgi:hypothetical protein
VEHADGRLEIIDWSGRAGAALKHAQQTRRAVPRPVSMPVPVPSAVPATATDVPAQAST